MGKNITELPELPEYTETAIHAVDDGILTYKATGAQIRTFMQGDLPGRVEYVEARAFVTGMTMEWEFPAAPSGWVLLQGGTIGSASSGATARAHADTEALFTLIWNSFDNTARPIQDSSGSPTTRGASAADDFAANKRIPLSDRRGLVSRGTGTQAINGRNKVGPSLGEKQEDQMQGHHHAVRYTANFSGGGSGHALHTGTSTKSNWATTMQDDGSNGTPRIGEETRVSSFGVNWIQKL